jgi:hypothetical protein
LWHEYPIPTNEKQKEIIRALRQFIQLLEKDGLIAGFAFNHYSATEDPPSELRIRFEYRDEQDRKKVESQLETEVKKLLPSYINQERVWGLDTTDKHVLQAYEFGSRCAFLAMALIEGGRFPELYFSRAVNIPTQDGKLGVNVVPLEFQMHFNHGVMNSLGIPKVPDEQEIHIRALMDSTNSKTKQELINWLQANLKG